MRQRHLLVALTLALAWVASGASAQTYPLFRTVPAPGYIPQASFYNPIRDELVVLAFEGNVAQRYDANGTVTTPTSTLPTPLGLYVDGAAYDLTAGVAIVVRQTCELLELDPVTLDIVSRRTLVGSGTIAAPGLCTGVDIASDGSLLVADHNSPRILVYPRSGTVPTRTIDTGLLNVDNLSRAPGTSQIMVATNTSGTFELLDESGAVIVSPSTVGTGLILGSHTAMNTAGSDGLTFIGTTGRLWFCDHNGDPSMVSLSCYLQTRGCSTAADCPLPFIGCDLGTGQCQSAVCGDGLVQGGETCDDGGLVTGDGCSAGCVVEPGFACVGAPSVCTPGCTDNTAFGTDSGCTFAAPHCRTTGSGAPACEVCIDSSVDTGDLGCTPAAPFCIRNTSGVNVCVACNVDGDCDDRVECTTDTCTANVCSHTSRPEGEVCSIGVCGGPGDDRCVECVSDAQCPMGFVCHPGRFCMPVFTDAGPTLPDASIELPDASIELPDAALPLPDASMPLPDAALTNDAGRSDAGPQTTDAGPMDAGSTADTGPVGGSFVGGAICSASAARTGSSTAWTFILAALGLVLARRRNAR